MTLEEQAYNRGLEDGKNGYEGPDQVDIADLILQVPVILDGDGFPAKVTVEAERAIEDAYAKGYAAGKAS
jgi:hypothetical protein